MQPTIELREVCEILKCHISDFEFTQMVENDSYVIFNCSDEALEDLSEELDWEQGKGNTYRLNRLIHDYDLMRLLREQGILDDILIYVSW
jgi:hypothetical protein